MSDSLPAGGRDDLRVDVSRCLRMRFSESSCRRCADICPRAAVCLDQIIAVDSNHCSGCLLCTAVCPTGALEAESDFSACLEQLSRHPEPILGCIRTQQSSNATLACLGGLSEEHLLALCYSLPSKTTLNLTACNDCPNNPILPLLRQRLDQLATARFSGCGDRIAVAESRPDLHYRDETVNRRSFFKSLHKSLIQGAAVVLATTEQPTECRAEYAVKRLPLRQELLNRTARQLSPDLKALVLARYQHQVSFSENCITCQGCVAICPTGALQTDVLDEPPQFLSECCTGCGVCVEFCLDGALRLDS